MQSVINKRPLPEPHDTQGFIMLIRSTVIAATLLAASCAAFAADSINVSSMSCSGALTSSFSDGVSLACIGSLSLSTGSIESSKQIVLSATESLSLFDVTLTAPQVRLDANKVDVAGSQPAPLPYAGAVLGFEAGTRFPIGQSYSGVVIGDPSGTSPYWSGQAVPEPGTFALVALGLIGAGFVARRRAGA